MVLLTAIAWQTRLAAGPPPKRTVPVQGKQIFRYDTFGDEQLWTGVLRMHEAIATVSSATALKVGLKATVNDAGGSRASASPARSATLQ